MITHLPTAHYPRFHLAFPVSDLGNALEFKALGDINLLFAKNP